MTTIAYKDGILAADTQGNWGGTRTVVEKIYRGPGVVLAGAGKLWRLREIFAHVDQLAVGPRAPIGVEPMWRHIAKEFYDPQFDKAPDDTPSCLLIQPQTGNVLWLSGPRFRPIELTYPFVALGSGSEYALGAMATGASAADAIRIAASLDVHTGGEINEINVKELPL